VSQLPRAVRVRLADLESHYRALALALEQTSPTAYQEALTVREAERLVQHVYPIERPFEILSNYLVELARHGLDLAGKDSTGTASAVLDQLRAQGVISETRRAKLADVQHRRNELQHEYPDVRAAQTYDAASMVVAELPGFLRDYSAWLRSLGFGEERA
jgi:uncharacterized protein YutE (UPF0331/DUF86 family)